MEASGEFFSRIGEFFTGADSGFLSYATLVIRYVLPALVVIIVVRCAMSLLREKSEAELWGQLNLPNGASFDLNHWENVIGRNKASDVFLDFPSVSRNHAALIRDDKGDWRIYDIESKAGVFVNGRKVEDADGVAVNSGDAVKLGGADLIFVAADKTDEYEQAASRTKPGRVFKQWRTLLFVTEFQLLLGLQLCFSAGDSFTVALPLCFLALIAMMWTCYFFTRAMKRVAFEVETIAFLLSTLSFSVVASSSPSELVRQLLLLFMGVCLFFGFGWFLRDLNRAKKMRKPIAALGLMFLAANLFFSAPVFGARRWLVIAGVSFQPSEFVKIAFIIAGAATLERLFARRNLFAFISFTGVCLIALAMINDFGSALIFFVAYLLIAYLRSGDIATIFLSVGGAGFAGLLALQFRSHIAGRFSTWGRAWELADFGGYQQSRAMAAAASGGLFGVGAGKGWFERVFAADSDLVFAMLCEELGLIIAISAVCAMLVFAVFSARSAGAARSSFYVIAACGASTILVFQMLLNVLGSVDILPFTGVTFPFVSKGGTSLIACWGMLAFIKAADTRQNASFVVKTPKRPLLNDSDWTGRGDELYEEDLPSISWDDDPERADDTRVWWD